jgi:Dipeptidyl aminopeptidases/acylaminoacyl-peptidases
MGPEDAYNLNLVTDVRISNVGLLHVETWIKNDEYQSAIFLNKKRITFGGNEISPFLKDETMYYIKVEKEKAKLVKQDKFSEPTVLAELAKIKKFTFHKKGILILGEEVVDKNSPFVADKLKYRFDGRGLLRSRQALFILNSKLEKLVYGNFDVIDVATNGERVAIVATKKMMMLP